MSEHQFAISAFPAFRNSVRARWAPVLFEPIAGSYERFVIGVAVVGEGSFHLELANALDRLKCLYSDDAEGALFAVRLTAEQLTRDLSRRALNALTDPRPAISGIVIGECREAEGESLKAIGASWMSMLSSLYLERPDELLDLSTSTTSEVQASTGGGDRLPVLVMDYVRERRQGYVRFFSSDLQEGRRRRTAGRSHEVLIDFAGSKLVANFGTLKPGELTPSVNMIKRRLWDLKVDRDREPNKLPVRRYEMIVQSPTSDDPQLTERQYTNITEALHGLEGQADQEALRLRPLSTVAQIGDHVLTAEAA
jgi:hypothetical protein